MSPLLIFIIVFVLAFDSVLLFRLCKKFLDFKSKYFKSSEEGDSECLN